MSFFEFLKLLQSSTGINAALGFILGLLADNWPWFVGLDLKSKRLIMLAICLVVPLLSCAVGILGGYQALDFDAVIWPALWVGVAAWVGSQGYHTVANWNRAPSDEPDCEGMGCC